MTVVVNSRFSIPADELIWRFTPSGGPGGQHANRSSTRVELRWHPAASTTARQSLPAHLFDRLAKNTAGEVMIVVDLHRSQHRNRQEATHQLAQKVRASLAPPPKKRRTTKPTRGSQRRRVKAKRQRSQTKALRQKPTVDD